MLLNGFMSRPFGRSSTPGEARAPTAPNDPLVSWIKREVIPARREAGRVLKFLPFRPAWGQCSTGEKINTFYGINAFFKSFFWAKMFQDIVLLLGVDPI